jgi:hypothetical protein
MFLESRKRPVHKAYNLTAIVLYYIIMLLYYCRYIMYLYLTRSISYGVNLYWIYGM